VRGNGACADARVAPDTPARARTARLDLVACPHGNDSFSLFDAIGSKVATGPTVTNMSDLRAMSIEAATT
jgi:hydroxypyruvate reductase